MAASIDRPHRWHRRPVSRSRAIATGPRRPTRLRYLLCGPERIASHPVLRCRHPRRWKCRAYHPPLSRLRRFPHENSPSETASRLARVLAVALQRPASKRLLPIRTFHPAKSIPLVLWATLPTSLRQKCRPSWARIQLVRELLRWRMLLQRQNPSPRAWPGHHPQPRVICLAESKSTRRKQSLCLRARSRIPGPAR